MPVTDTLKHADELGIDRNCIGVMGVSAGGGLAAALCLLARDRGEGPVAFQLLDQPMLDDRQITPSSREDGLAVWSRVSNAFGWKAYLIIQLAVIMIAGSAGVWLFYVQHQFEGVYWERREDWDYTAAALQGSSFYKLPKVLQWFSGNIGFHHIHHLSARIPNYNLERCHWSHPMFRDVKPITMVSSLKSFSLRLWDENLKKLVGYRHMRNLRREQKRSN